MHALSYAIEFCDNVKLNVMLHLTLTRIISIPQEGKQKYMELSIIVRIIKYSKFKKIYKIHTIYRIHKKYNNCFYNAHLQEKIICKS